MIYLSQYCKEGEVYFEDTCLPVKYGLPEKRFTIVGYRCPDGVGTIDFICPKGGLSAFFELDKRVEEKKRQRIEMVECMEKTNEIVKAFIADMNALASETVACFGIPAERIKAIP